MIHFLMPLRNMNALLIAVFLTVFCTADVLGTACFSCFYGEECTANPFDDSYCVEACDDPIVDQQVLESFSSNCNGECFKIDGTESGNAFTYRGCADILNSGECLPGDFNENYPDAAKRSLAKSNGPYAYALAGTDDLDATVHCCADNKCNGGASLSATIAVLVLSLALKFFL